VRVYVSGPIGGRVEGNYPAFVAAAEMLRSQGHEVVVPHDLGADHQGPCTRGKETGIADDPHVYGCYLVRDMVELAQCDALYALVDWQESPGGRAEMAFAQALKLEIVYQEEKPMEESA
jgi:hypothetical protein